MTPIERRRNFDVLDSITVAGLTEQAIGYWLKAGLRSRERLSIPGMLEDLILRRRLILSGGS